MLIGCLPRIASTGDFYASSGIEVIVQSLFVILNTRPESRVWQPEFGCRLKEYIWDLMDSDTIQNLSSEISNAIKTWEPRIKLNKVDVEPISDIAGNKINILIDFTYEERDYKQTFNIKANSDMMEMSVYDLIAVPRG
jgi:hypothetical protein